MKKYNRYIYIAVFLIFICSISGCSTIGAVVGGGLKGIGSIIGGTLKLVGKALELVGKLPMPPPGVF